MKPDFALRRLAARQHGLLTYGQATDAGVTRAGIRHRVQRGEWERLSSRVLRVVGSPAGPKQDLMAAVLDAGAGAVVSHESACALWALPGFPPGPLEVSRPRSTTRMRPVLGELHESRYLPASHCTEIDGIPVTGLARTLFDLAGAPSMSPARAERAVDNALARSRPLLARLHTMLVELATNGRPGIALMRELLADRSLGYVPPASGLEARALRLFDEAGIATERQVDIGDEEEWIGRVDFRVTGTPIVVEIDSTLHHTSPSDRARDARRDARLRASGRIVVRVTEDELFQRPWVLELRVRKALAETSAHARASGA